jgi:hypothetical protein
MPTADAERIAFIRKVHTPLTPFRQDGKVDLALLPRLIEFHLSHGADAICAPTHAGESPSLSEDERRTMIREVVRIVNGRVPVIAHISGAAHCCPRGQLQMHRGPASTRCSPPRRTTGSRRHTCWSTTSARSAMLSTSRC